MKATTETIAEMLAGSDHARLEKGRPRVRLAFLSNLKRMIIKFLAY